MKPHPSPKNLQLMLPFSLIFCLAVAPALLISPNRANCSFFLFSPQRRHSPSPAFFLFVFCAKQFLLFEKTFFPYPALAILFFFPELNLWRKVFRFFFLLCSPSVLLSFLRTFGAFSVLQVTLLFLKFSNRFNQNPPSPSLGY